MRVKTEDIMFWVLIGLIVAVAIWKLFGSPTDTTALISIALFFAGSELLLWRILFKIDNRTNIGFMKMKNELDKRFFEVDNKFNVMNGKLDKIETLIKKK